MIAEGQFTNQIYTLIKDQEYVEAIKILNIPINDYSCKTDRNFENHRRQNYLKGFNKNINSNKNRQVLNSKKFE